MFVAFFVLEERKIKTIKLIKKNHLISVNEVSEAIQLKWKEANICFTQPLILKRVYSVVRELIRKYLNVRKRGKGIKQHELKQKTFFKTCEGNLMDILFCK